MTDKDAIDALSDIKNGLKEAQTVMRQAGEELETRNERITRLTDALAGMVGLFQLIESRAGSYPADRIANVVKDFHGNHRLAEARQVLREERERLTEGGATTGNQSIQRDNLPCPPSV